MKTDGYLIFNYSSLDVYEPHVQDFVITHFNVTVVIFCG
jgi:hypothetical protein